ncbi:MAG: HAD-IIB family hydrolase [Verrucomicrobiae bacterium]|nr:HAD-IIB family hydrolase [Verrucomicrobiae bacterium]
MRLFSTDIDGTIFNGPESAEIFAEFWNFLSERPESPLLVYNTGRGLVDALQLIDSTELPVPDFLISGVGTEIYRPGDGQKLEAWSDRLGHEWSVDVVQEVMSRSQQARPQPPECQGAHKSSWFWIDADPEEIQETVARIESRGIRVQAVYSSNRDLDLLPLRANKGNAVAWLMEHLGLSGGDVVVAGDSGNDASMYQVPGVRGVLVANAELALVDAVSHLGHFRATKVCAAGVREGLEHHLKNPKS